MRVIAGEKRGTRLMDFKGDWIRPTTDKVKEAVFSSIQGELANTTVFVDLFGGSGAMGIEALSRGVDHVYFFDISRESIAIIKKNLQKTGYTSSAVVRNISAEKGIIFLCKNSVKCDMIYMDPPYAEGGEMIALAEIIVEKDILSPEGIIIMEHEKGVVMPETIQNLIQFKEKQYGGTTISYYCRKVEDE